MRLGLLLLWPGLVLAGWVAERLDAFLVVGACGGFLLFTYLFLTQDVDLVPASGSEPATLVRHRLGIAPTHVPLEPRSTVRLERVGASVQLVAQHASRSVRAPLAWLSVYIRHSRDADVLRAVADVVERSGAAGAESVASTIRAQAAHADRGGTVEDSPLATRVSRAFRPSRS